LRIRPARDASQAQHDAMNGARKGQIQPPPILP
jgi:hypothetical protein